jgi:dihydrofolate synthase/folylpolyglutamate synthase
MHTTSAKYDACLAEMYGLRRFGIKLGLDTIQGILAELGNPHQRFSAIHVAGTNGKGSVASTLAHILRLAGFRVGLYTSPHLVRFNERICVNGHPIDDQQVVDAYATVKQAVRGDRTPTFFELTTAMAFSEFGRRKVDWAVIETGMGGRLDATNAILPALAIITNIALEHRDYLGGTLAQIAAEKAGIIKPLIPLVTGIQQKTARSVIYRTAEHLGAPVYSKGKAFRLRREANKCFTYFGLDHTWRQMRTNLEGRHQADNAALVLAACELLMRNGLTLSRDLVARGLASQYWPGRLEVVCKEPLVILDGAHNPAAARLLGNHLARRYAGRRIIMVVGILKDKPYPVMLKALLKPCHEAIFTQPKIHRALPAERLESCGRPWVSQRTIIPDVSSAVAAALASATANDVVCIAGSLYVVGEAQQALQAMEAPNSIGSTDPLV